MELTDDKIKELQAKQAPFTKAAYYFILFAGIVLLLFGNLSLASTFIPIAMVFDPFDETVSWKNRPIWQRTLLITHLILSLALISYYIFYS